ncbi:MAG TPA: prephenate dehydrogenase/arogenate dehydrogenase family protein [Polyangiaceae bacterium]|nr:prephenate dehydrogenase/arogenate dehydrogenase family protein [Polyangiaceae bacterium]
MTRLSILGFGLIGGSVALALRRALPAIHVTAIDLGASLEKVRSRGIADALVDVSDTGAVERAFETCTLAVFAAPVRVIRDQLRLAVSRAPVITDCGSTKRAIVASARREPRAGRFVPGHPMAGGPEGGVEHARADLFEGRPWIVCPEGADADAVASVERLIEAVGARPVVMSAGAHDAAVARTSHVPQLLGSALSVLVARAGAMAAAGPAFERATQSAGGPTAMWGDIFETNGDEIARALAELFAELSPVQQELADARGVEHARALLENARKLRPRG